jgi:hypothetical protein
LPVALIPEQRRDTTVQLDVIEDLSWPSLTAKKQWRHHRKENEHGKSICLESTRL